MLNDFMMVSLTAEMVKRTHLHARPRIGLGGRTLELGFKLYLYDPK